MGFYFIVTIVDHKLIAKLNWCFQKRPAEVAVSEWLQTYYHSVNRRKPEGTHFHNAATEGQGQGITQGAPGEEAGKREQQTEHCESGPAHNGIDRVTDCGIRLPQQST